MDFYGRAVLVITKFTALQETCSKSSFYYWIWFSRKKKQKKQKKTHIKGNQLSAFVRFLKNSIVVCFFNRNFVRRQRNFSRVLEELKRHLVSMVRILLNFWKESFNIPLIRMLRLFCLKVLMFESIYPVLFLVCNQAWTYCLL